MSCPVDDFLFADAVDEGISWQDNIVLLWWPDAASVLLKAIVFGSPLDSLPCIVQFGPIIVIVQFAVEPVKNWKNEDHEGLKNAKNV